jgi:heptose III glucuronosyltransferase
MSKLPLLSLIVPVYNVAPYLPACLDSLLENTPANCEIIVIDDGSTDGCPGILAKYAQRLPQMRVIRQANAGLSAARNTGMAQASGEYLAFVDSDDFIVPNAYVRQLERAEAERLDMVLFNAVRHFEGRENDTPVYEAMPATGVIKGSDWLRSRLSINQLPHMVCFHLYRRSFLTAGGWLFVPDLIHEDVIWTTEVLLAAQRVAYEPVVDYYYRQPIRRFSPEQNQSRFEKIVRSSVYNAHCLRKIAFSSSVDKELQGLILFQMVDGALSVFHKLGKMPDRSARGSITRELRDQGWFSFLWENARDFSQRRKIAKRYLRSLFIQT